MSCSDPSLHANAGGLSAIYRAVVAICFATLLGGCYTVNLASIPPVPGNPLPLAGRIEIPPETREFTYDVRSFAAGIANRFRIRVGEALVRYADAYLKPVLREGQDAVIRVQVDGFGVQGFEAHIDARFTVMLHGEVLFNKKYQAEGVGYFAQTAWGGVFAMKSSMRRTTNEALRSLFEQFLEDVHVAAVEWEEEGVDVEVEEIQ